MELREYLRILLKRWWLIVPLTMLSLTTALLFSYNQTPVYEAQSSYVTKLDSTLPGGADTMIYAMDTLSGRERIFITYCEVMMSQTIRNEAFKLVGVSPEEVEADDNYKVTCTNLPETNVLLVSVQGPSPSLVVRLNEAVGLLGIARASTLYSYFPLEKLDPVTLNETPISPKNLQNGVLGGVLGLALGVSLALMIEYLRSPLDRLEAMSIRHPQLGIYNERYFRQRFEEETNRAHARLRPIAVAMLRLDPNEDFALLPEVVQTTLLRSAALMMNDSLRASDLVAYLKPRTFGIILPETPGDEAQSLLQKLHMDLRAQTFEAGGYVSSFVANTGLVSSSGGTMGYQTTLQKAVEALRAADEIGENTIHLVRATPRPFLTSEGADETSASGSDATLPFNGHLFDNRGLEDISWQDVQDTTGDLADWPSKPGNGKIQDADGDSLTHSNPTRPEEKE